MIATCKIQYFCFRCFVLQLLSIFGLLQAITINQPPIKQLNINRCHLRLSEIQITFSELI